MITRKIHLKFCVSEKLCVYVAAVAAAALVFIIIVVVFTFYFTNLINSPSVMSSIAAAVASERATALRERI